MQKKILLSLSTLLVLSTALPSFAQTAFDSFGDMLLLADTEASDDLLFLNQTSDRTLNQKNKKPHQVQTKTAYLGKSALIRQKQNQKLLKNTKKNHPDLSWAKEYTTAKQNFTNATGISYTIDISVLGQRGSPNGKTTPWQTGYYGSINWDLFQSKFGSGSIQAAYTLIRYWNKNASILGNRIGIGMPINDYTEKANYFDQLSYTHQGTGSFDWLSVTLGQFPLYNFDGTAYNSNQQINFINEALSQNQTSLYPTAGIGGYITLSPNEKFSFSAGFQNGNNVSGDRLTVKHFDANKTTSFLSMSYNPTNKLGDMNLSLLIYHQPSVPDQIGHANGWSFNVQQNIGKKLAVFGRINGVSKGISGFDQSYMIGGVYNNPFNRNALDQLGLAYAGSKINKSVMGENARSFENVIEGYFSFGVSSFMILTPDVQFYINPALNQKSKTATVLSLRATVMF